MNRLHLLSVVRLAGSRAFAVLLSFAAMTVIARELGPHELGIWSIMLALHSYAVHGSELGLRSVVTAEAGYAGGGFRHLIGAYLRLRFAACLFLLFVIFLVSPFLDEGWRSPLLVMAAALIAPSLQLDWIALARNRTGEASAMLLARPACFLVLVLVAPDPKRAFDIALVFAASWWFAAVASWMVLRHRPDPLVTDIGEPPPRMGERAMLRLGWPLMTATVLSQAQANLDLLLVAAVLGAGDAGHYYLASAIVTAGLVPANAMGQLALARLARFRDNMPAFGLRLVQELGLSAALALTGAAALAALAPLLLPTIFGADFAPSAGILLYLLPWLVLASLSTVAQGALAAIRQQRLMLQANFAMIAALAVLLPLAGYLGRIEAFATARSLAECVRLFVLLAPFAHPASLRPILANAGGHQGNASLASARIRSAR